MKKEIEFKIYMYYVYANCKLVERLVAHCPWLVIYQEENSKIIFFYVPEEMTDVVERFIPRSRIKYVCASYNSVVL